MADSAPKSADPKSSTSKSSAPIVVSLCVAAILLVTAVITGPSVVDCTSNDNFGACLRQGLEHRGLLPAGDGSEMTADASSGEAAGTAETAPKIAAEPEMAATPAPAPQETAAKPTFGMRVEPDGSVLIAGSGTPGAEIEVFANGALLGTVTVEKTGDWVLVPDAPLPTGGVEITVGSAEKGNQAAQSVIVVIQDDRTSEPLVVASTPGAPSEILQGKTASGSVAEAPASASPSVGSAPQMDVASLPKEQQAPAQPESPAMQAPAPATPAAAAPAESAPTEMAPAEAPAIAAEPVKVAPAEVAPVEAAPVETAPVEATPKAAEAPPAKPVTPPSIDAIEVDGGRNFFAGGGEEGATVRLYVNDQYVADGMVEGGRWLIETDKDFLTDPSQRVRLDMLQTGSSDVAARAEVNFEISLPETAVAAAPAESAKPDETMKVASAPEATAADASTPEIEAPAAVVPEAPKPMATAPEPMAATPEPKMEPAAPVAPSNGVAEINAAAADNNAALLASPPAVPVAPAAPAPAPDVKPEAKPEPMQTAEAAPQPQTKLPVQPGTVATRPVSQNGATAPAVTEPQVAEAPVVTPKPEPAAPAPEQKTTMAAPVATSPQPEVAAKPAETASAAAIPTLRATQVGDPADQRFASGNAIIRRGDNLWTIARRVYGRGIRYTAIYEANQDQIRNPDLIYPGQVFDLPAAGQ